MRNAVGAVLVLLLTGCASVPIAERFAATEDEVSAKTGLAVTWPGVTTEQTAAAALVDNLLADGLTAEEAAQITLLQNPRLQAVYAGYGIALADLVQAGLPPNPVAEIIVRFQEESEFNLRVWELIVVQDFLDILLIPLRRQLAGAEFERARLLVEREVIAQATASRIAFYHMQAAEQNLELMGNALLAAESSYEMAMRLYEAGNIPQTQLLSERARYEQAKLAVAEAEREIVERREALNARMGLWGGATRWGVAERLPAPPREELALDSLESRVVDASLDLEIAWREIEGTARRNRIRVVEAVVPELSIGGEFERETEIETEIGENAAGEPRLEHSEGPDLWWRGPTLGVAIPIFDQGQPARAQARMAVRQAWDRYTALAVELRAEARRTRYELRYARLLAQYYRRVVVPTQVRFRTQTQLRYNAMFLGVFHLLRSKEMEIDAGRAYIDALRDYWVARARMEALLLGTSADGGAQDMTAAPGGMTDGPGGGH
jgi:cobalt-zinc-cadmium efflux system outer membrane protein